MVLSVFGTWYKEVQVEPEKSLLVTSILRELTRETVQGLLQKSFTYFRKV